MLDDLSFYRPIAAALTLVALLFFVLPLTLMFAKDKGYKRWQWFFAALLLGPIAPLTLHWLPLKRAKPLSPHRHPRFHPIAASVGSVIALGSVALATLVGLKLADVQGEDLQIYLVTGIILGGFLAGVGAALISRRVAYFETLLAVLVLLSSATALGSRLDNAFTYGTTPVFFLVLSIAAILMFEVARILGGSVGFMLAGDGHLSLHFAYESWIGRRYLMAKRRSSFISVITIISIGGVAVGVWAMLVVLSVMSGFSQDLRSKILGANAHIIVMRYGTDFTEYPEVEKKLRSVKGITGVSPFVLNEVMVSSEINLSGAIIKGIDPGSAPQVSDLAKNMVQGSLDLLDHPEKISAFNAAGLPDKNPADGSDWEPKKPVPTGAAKPAQHENSAPPPDPSATAKETPTEPAKTTDDDEMAALAALAGTTTPHPGAPPNAPGLAPESGPLLPGIIIGQELARSLKVFVGDPVNVVSPVGELGPTGPVPKARAFRVAGIFYSGMYEYDAKFIYIHLSQAQDFFSTKGAVTGIEIKVDDIENTSGISRGILKTLGGYPYRTKDWKEMNRNLFSALKLEKIAMFIILAFIILVASFNILSTLIMVVLEKGKEIAILKSMGVTDSSIMKIFVVYGLIIGSLGTSIGVVLGMVSCLLIRQFGVGLDPEVYYISQLPVRMNPVEFVVVAVSAIIVSYLATLYPSLQAARLNPVDGLRYD